MIAERGFSETRIADVARRVGASPALVIYYFGTKDQLLTDALRYSEDAFYERATSSSREASTVRDRLEMHRPAHLHAATRPTFPARGACGSTSGPRRFAIRRWPSDRVELERRWRTTIADVVRRAVDSGEIASVDADQFAVTWGVLLDGLSIQVALQDEMVDQEVAFDIAMRFAEQALGAAGEIGQA